MIYLDYAASTPAAPEVLERFCRTETLFPANANSVHPAGAAAAAELRRITERIAALLGVAPEELIYTSGTSEANNLALKGIARTSRHHGRHIITTALEHASVGAPLTYLQEQGYEVDLLEIGRDGKIELESLRELFREDTILVSVSAVDSELGTLQPIGEIAQLVHTAPHARLHVDAAQAVGKTALSLAGADTFSLGAHKFYGLKGSGLLCKRKGLVLEPLIHGGVGAALYRSGTPTLSLNAALEEALSRAITEQAAWTEAVAEKNLRLRKALSAYPLVRINSPADAVPHILNLSVQGVKGSVFQQALSERGVCVSVKSACSSDGTPSKAVLAVSRDRRTALSSWRISLSHRTTEEELNDFLQIFDECYRALTAG